MKRAMKEGHLERWRRKDRALVQKEHLVPGLLQGSPEAFATINEGRVFLKAVPVSIAGNESESDRPLGKGGAQLDLPPHHARQETSRRPMPATKRPLSWQRRDTALPPEHATERAEGPCILMKAWKKIEVTW